MLLKLTNETKNDQEVWTSDDQKEFSKYLLTKTRMKSQGLTKARTIVEL